MNSAGSLDGQVPFDGARGQRRHDQQMEDEQMMEIYP
jgi:hypothetical protein